MDDGRDTDHDTATGTAGAFGADAVVADGVDDEPDELEALVLDFLHGWPSQHPSAAKIANAVGRPPREVIEVLARLRSRDGLPKPPEEIVVESPPPSWDRAN